jgi:hypothetical protein
MRDAETVACAEPLECRSLLSSAVQAVEFERPGDDTDTSIAASALPASILTNLNADYPSARMIEASFSDDDGPEFDVTIQLGGRQMEVTFNPLGEITGIEEVISTSELPRPVIDWISQNFPRAQLDDATIANDGGIVSYGVLIVTREGRELDATLWLGDIQSSAHPFAVDQAPEKLLRFPGQLPAPPGGAWLSNFPQDDPSPQQNSSDATVHPNAAEPTPARACQQAIALDLDGTDPTPPRQPGHAVVYPPLAEISRAASALSGTLHAFAAGPEPVQWVPQMTGLLSQVLPANLLSIENGFAQIVQSVDALAQKMTGNAIERSWSTRMTVTSLLIAGALLLRHPRKSRGIPILINTPNSSWSWVFGTSTRK